MGQTIKAAVYRLGSLQSGTPNQLTLRFCIRVADIDAAESAIHAELQADHLRGEWYRSEESKIAECFYRVGAEHWSDINGQPCQGYQFGYESMQFYNMRKESLGSKEREEATTVSILAQI